MKGKIPRMTFRFPYANQFVERSRNQSTAFIGFLCATVVANKAKLPGEC